MEKKLKFIFFAIEVNLILWLGALFAVQPDVDLDAKTMVLIGCITAAILQHIAYYSLYKELKK